ncbi:MAG TPA: hypothetical protein IAD50_05495 [Candidatus Egerieisoma faecipullorum]|uniref:YkuD domain-containing protein n=1 Tax=Candidatus Egerieisoma faecipullorum TaxID=2840963 RepID=A0A9D1I7N2_9CLOT|nr:hypothetical protein [Candidatus Egerieisoma faecipullorum]
MKKNTVCKFLVFAAALLSALFLFSACAGEKTEAPQESGQVVAGLTSPLPSPATKGAHYEENMELFGDTLNNIYTYECVYFYYKTGDREAAYRDTVLMKTKLFYAIEKDYYLNEEEKTEIAANAESYLKMQYDELGRDEAYTPDSAAQELFGISFEQYKMLRMCESLTEKCFADLLQKTLQDGNLDENEIKNYYESNKEAYDFVILRYISYQLDPGGGNAGNQSIVAEAEALCSRLNTIEDLLAVAGGESDRQSEGDSSGQVTVYLNDSDNLFYEFIHDTGTSAGAKTVVYDTDHVYVAMCEGYFTWETSSVVAESVKEDYAEAAVEAEMTKNTINYEEPEDWYKMSGLEEIKIAKSRDDYTAVVSNLKIAEEAATLFLTIQDPGDTTTCRFYAYTKEDGEWKEEFKVAGYVGRSGIADAANRVEGDGTSPAGVYSFGMLFGIQDNPGGLQREYKKVDEDDYWDGDRNSDTYNQHVRGSEMPDTWNAAASEHLIDYKYSYNYAAMVNYNVNPTIKGKGSAIFLHCTHPGSLYSAGCISIPESKMIRALRLINDQAYIVLVRSAEDLLAYC